MSGTGADEDIHENDGDLVRAVLRHFNKQNFFKLILHFRTNHRLESNFDDSGDASNNITPELVRTAGGEQVELKYIQY